MTIKGYEVCFLEYNETNYFWTNEEGQKKISAK